MKFEDLFIKFIAGTPIKREVWQGYWIYNNGIIEIHTKTGDVINFLDTNDVIFTIGNILQDDWEIATKHNSNIDDGTSIIIKD